MEVQSEDRDAWMIAARCKDLDPAMFFPRDGAGVKFAKKICAGCPVRTSCLKYAVDNGIVFGIWGGVSERGRRQLRHKPGSSDAVA